MERKEIYRRQQAYEQELTAYSGDDPLDVRYEFISWLDGNYGKENVMDIFFPTLEDTLKCFWNVVQYQQDSRFIQLLVTYITMQTNPTEMYKSVYEKGTGIESPLFYSSWADTYVKEENFKKADEIFNLGLTKVKVKSELEYAYKEFLVSLGKKFLQRIDSDNVQSACPKCSCNSQKNKTNSSHTSSNKDDVFEWALNPLKVGEPDTFKCPLVVPDPPDSNKIPMYPKSQVYVGDKEYCLEEIMARYYQEKLKQKEARNSTKNELDKVEIKGDVVALKQNSQMEVDENQECIMKIAGQENANLHIPEDVVHNHITPQKNSAPFPKPLLLHDSLHISQTSYTAHMKEAMNVVQEMWSSPTPSVSTSVNTRSRTLFKNNAAEPPPKDSQINNEDCGVAQIPSRSNHFAIYTEEDQDENCMPTPQGCAIRPDKPKAVTSLKKDTLQMRKPSGKGNVLSERKPKGSIEKPDLEKRPSTNKKQLPFSTAIAEEDKRSEMLAMKLGDISIANPPMQQNRVINIKPLLPVDPEDNISDETCNTKAFNFSLPSSTPIQNKKCHSTRVSVESQGIVEEQIIKSKNPGDLSMILEASKERYSNSSSSNGCALRGQSTALQTVTTHQEFCFPSKTMQTFLISNVTPRVSISKLIPKFSPLEESIYDEFMISNMMNELNIIENFINEEKKNIYLELTLTEEREQNLRINEEFTVSSIKETKFNELVNISNLSNSPCKNNANKTSEVSLNGFEERSVKCVEKIVKPLISSINSGAQIISDEFKHHNKPRTRSSYKKICDNNFIKCSNKLKETVIEKPNEIDENIKPKLKGRVKAQSMLSLKVNGHSLPNRRQSSCELQMVDRKRTDLMKISVNECVRNTDDTDLKSSNITTRSSTKNNSTSNNTNLEIVKLKAVKTNLLKEINQTPPKNHDKVKKSKVKKKSKSSSSMNQTKKLLGRQNRKKSNKENIAIVPALGGLSIDEANTSSSYSEKLHNEIIELDVKFNRGRRRSNRLLNQLKKGNLKKRLQELYLGENRNF